MNAWEWIKALGIYGPIAAMIVVGFILAVRSGIARAAKAGWSRRLAENLSHTVVMLGGCLLGLVVLHQLVGQQIPRIW